VDMFSAQINSLLELSVSTRLLEKLSYAMHSSLFDDREGHHDDDDEVSDDSMRGILTLFITSHSFLLSMLRFECAPK
jgi:hypothetical protein